jgi:predicted DNA-binding transcriptional regulator AlpA
VDETKSKEPWITTAEAAAHLGKNPAWLHNYGAKVGVPRFRLGRHYRYKVSALDAWLEQNGAAH